MTTQQPRSGQQNVIGGAGLSRGASSTHDRAHVAAIEQRPSSSTGSGRTAGEVFLTPRVIDQGAFDELSRSLREMVREAAKQNADLRASVAQASRIGNELRCAEQGQQENLALAAAALKRIEERTSAIDSLLEHARGTTAAAEQFDRLAEEVIARQLGAFEARIEDALASAAARAGEIEDRIARASSGLEARISETTLHAQGAIGPSVSQLTALCERAEAMIGRLPDSAGGEAPRTPGSLGDVVERGESLRQECQFASRQFDAIRAQADQARTILGESLNDMCSMIDRLTERADDLRREADRAKSVAAEIGKDTDAHTRRVKTAVEDVLSQALPGIEAVKSELGQLVAQAHQLQGDASLAVRVGESTLSQLREVVAQLSPWQHVVFAKGAVGSSQDASNLPEPIRRIVESVRVEMRRELGSIAAALRSAADRAESIDERLDSSQSPGIVPPPPQPAPGTSVNPAATAPGDGQGRSTPREPRSVPVTRIDLQTPVVLEDQRV